MKTDDKILELFKEHKDSYLSGEEISKTLGISRQALWKHIEKLRETGYVIEAVPHLGYKLMQVPDKILVSEIKWDLKTKFIGKEIRYYESVGSTNDIAYEMAEKTGIKPMTIQNFEHLMVTLSEFQSKGINGYIGCCCEGFYSKHQDDFEANRVPGVLLDIEDETCYDLGKEREAYNGSFEKQTTLKLDLLSKLLNYTKIDVDEQR